LTACERVVRNGGAAGVDEMTVEALEPHLREHYKPTAGGLRN
jgi:hypothetical protein